MISLALSLPTADTDRILMCNCQQLFHLCFYLHLEVQRLQIVITFVINVIMMRWIRKFQTLCFLAKSSSSTLEIFASNAIVRSSNVGRTGGRDGCFNLTACKLYAACINLKDRIIRQLMSFINL